MKEIKLEDVFNKEKKQGLKEFIEKQKQDDENYLDSFGVTKTEFETHRNFNKQAIISIMEKDEELGLYEEEELLSDCCGAPEWQDETGICNECREHAEFSNNQD